MTEDITAESPVNCSYQLSSRINEPDFAASRLATDKIIDMFFFIDLMLDYYQLHFLVCLFIYLFITAN